MTKKAETIKLLILHESPDDAEQLMNLIRNSGRATRGQMIESSDGLLQALGSGQWDLMLLRPEANEIFAMECLKEVKKQSKDIPAILLVDEYDPEEVVEGLREGYEDVVVEEDHDRLILVIQRELRNLMERRARRTAELHLREAEKRCAVLLDSSRDAITYVTDGMHTYANEAYLELFGYDDADDLEGMPIMDMVAAKDHEEFKQFLRAYSAGESDTNEFVCHGLCTDGTDIQARMIFSNATYDGEPCTQILIRTNQADAELQERLKEISSQDLLTGLFNRSHFTQELDNIMQWAVTQSKTAVLAYIQLDNFASVQSDIGLAGADMVLADVATLLRESLPQGTMLARFGDEIFTALIKERSLEEGRSLGEALRSAIEDHLSEVQERTVQVTASIGVTLISENTDDAEEIITRAHQASEQVREENPLGNGVSVFDPASIKKIDPSDTGAIVQDAIDKGLFKLLFQPVIDLRGGSGELYEAFLRMVDEDGKEVSPNEFLGAASQQDLSEKIDRWVILQSIKLLSDHRSNGHDTKLIINITGESLKDQTLLPWLSVALKAARMPSDAIVFQFSESDATTYLKQAKEFTRGLRELHCKVSISRFGCALNPFNTLKHLEVDYLKVDGSFMKEIASEESKEALKEMVAAAHAQGKLTIAPFVESAAILSTLWQIGVNYIQGYYLQAPTEQMNYDFSSDE
ncbi:MAG: ferrous iron transporter C [Pseudomonadales bacterium]|jgi:multidomain signaling protein FimX|uniref:EAL domain-containing response regulator n=1 Tax=unclassified Ketobacter TaxID=2639109 RepID=UPI000C951202|nr:MULTISPECIES: EAL domain-containing protein [unclassified Ketobacter]MAA60928.1 ferrous iron transporter C [Pseudomonadales bacterium]MEC8813889.1 EAL domain-containing protein [Pseudomonadota bacterium]TNC90902.1 MAG: ferrous iron transporter C [Alcanivorax sp.]HAG94780.1 ferrous iron transporter C [Gammaproteobacteria bacterium]MAQ24041.1 ferrous iron transporter C [Pseudomonadales bacterium]|tara:strand:+ start:1756 stop:3834 length:2079 start_codon:yes stop_codon:yes gene_type:complete